MQQHNANSNANRQSNAKATNYWVIQSFHDWLDFAIIVESDQRRS
jgi:hypothetical protein